MGGPHLLKGRVNQRRRIAKLNLHAIILEDTHQCFAKESFDRYPYPLSLSQSDVPQAIPQVGGIPHRPGRSVEGPIFRTMVDNPPSEQVVQNPIVVRLNLTPMDLIQPSQGYQGLVEELVIQG